MVYSLVSHDPDSDDDEDMKNLDKTVTVSFENLYNSAKFHTYYETGVENALNQDGVKQLGVTIVRPKPHLKFGHQSALISPFFFITKTHPQNLLLPVSAKKKKPCMINTQAITCTIPVVVFGN